MNDNPSHKYSLLLGGPSQNNVIELRSKVGSAIASKPKDVHALLETNILQSR